jgi:hypothetical protein
MRTFTAVVERCSETGLFVGYVPDLPGAHSQGETLDDLNRKTFRKSSACSLRATEPESIMIDAAWLVPLLCILIFPFAWLIITTIMRLLSKMTRTLEVETGPLLRESPWGSASINGIGMNNCVKIAEYPTGWLVRTMWLTGGGKLWLHKSELRGENLKPGNLFFPQSRALLTNEHRVRLYGRLAGFVS